MWVPKDLQCTISCDKIEYQGSKPYICNRVPKMLNQLCDNVSCSHWLWCTALSRRCIICIYISMSSAKKIIFEKLLTHIWCWSSIKAPLVYPGHVAGIKQLSLNITSVACNCFLLDQQDKINYSDLKTLRHAQNLSLFMVANRGPHLLRLDHLPGRRNG